MITYHISNPPRAHHKFTDTDADPTNAKRGFFFSHVGCFLMTKHPEVTKRGRTIDLQDLYDDPIVMFQHRHYALLTILVWGLIPGSIPILCWNENPLNSILVCVFLRHVYMLNSLFMGSSFNHMAGAQPYDNRITAVDNIIRHTMLGEGLVYFITIKIKMDLGFPRRFRFISHFY